MSAEELRALAIGGIKERGCVRSNVLGELLGIKAAAVEELLVDDVRDGSLISCDVQVHGGRPLKEYRIPAGKMPEFKPRKGPAPMQFGRAQVEATRTIVRRESTFTAPPAAGTPEAPPPAAPIAPAAGGIAIEKGVPIPKRNTGKRSAIGSALRACEIGDSFTTMLRRPSIYSAAKTAGIKVVVRAESDGRHRVWRAA